MPVVNAATTVIAIALGVDTGGAMPGSASIPRVMIRQRGHGTDTIGGAITTAPMPMGRG